MRVFGQVPGHVQEAGGLEGSLWAQHSPPTAAPSGSPCPVFPSSAHACDSHPHEALPSRRKGVPCVPRRRPGRDSQALAWPGLQLAGPLTPGGPDSSRMGPRPEAASHYWRLTLVSPRWSGRWWGCCGHTEPPEGSPWIALCGRVLVISVMKPLSDLDAFLSLCGKEAPGPRAGARRTPSVPRT